jgi:hypothetical protein
VTITRTNFTGGVQLSAENLPADLTATFNPATLSGSATASTVTIAAAAAAAPATTSITIRATGSGVTDATSALSLIVAAAPAYTLTLASPTTSITQGASGSIDVALARTNFTGTVTFAVSGLPTGATAAFAPTSTTTNASVLTIMTGTAAAGTYPITVTGTAAGLTDRTVTFSLGITAPPSYTLATAASSLSILQGAGGTMDAFVTRTNFTGDVDLAVTGLPAGAMASFSLNPVSGGAVSSTLAIATGTAVPGTYALTITGTATGLTDRIASLGLVITASGAPATAVYTFCAANAPVWFASQNGTSGAWTAASGGASNSYSFTVSGVGAVAYVQAVANDAATWGYQTTIQYGTAAELQATGATMCGSTGTAKMVTGKVLGLGTSGEAVVALDSARTVVTVGPYILSGVHDGVHDLIASRHSLGGDILPDRVIISRGLNPAAGSALADIDFNTTGVATASATLTVSGLGATPARVAVDFQTQNGTLAPLTSTTSSGGATTVYGIPAASLIAGDVHSYHISVNDANDYRASITYFTQIANRTIAMGPVVATPSFTTVATSPYTRVSASLASQAAYDGSILLAYVQGPVSASSPAQHVYVLASAGYFGGLPATWNLTIPDFSAATGFDSSWALSSATLTDCYLVAFGQTPSTIQNGSSVAWAMRHGSFTSSPAVSGARRTLALQPSGLSRAQRAAQKEQLLRMMNPRVYRQLSRFR